MKVIYKYPIQYNAENNTVSVILPKGAKVISVLDLEMDTLTGYIYAIVDPKVQPSIEREVIWIGTGLVFTPEQEKRIQTYQFLGTHRDGAFVWHIWISPEPIEKVEQDYVDRFMVTIDPETKKVTKIYHDKL